MITGVVAGSVVYFVLPFPTAFKVPCIMPIVIFVCAIGFVRINGMYLPQLVAAMFETLRLYKHPAVIRGRKEDIDGICNNDIKK